MCKFIGKFNEQILRKLRKNEMLRLYSIVHVAMDIWQDRETAQSLIDWDFNDIDSLTSP